MTSLVQFGPFPLISSRQVTVPGYNAAYQAGTLSIERLPTETVGDFVLTLTNVVVGSAIQIETQAGASIENRTATVTSEVFTIPAYGFGSALNDIRIKVRKGSGAPYYKPFETLATAIVGAQSIYTAQQLDE